MKKFICINSALLLAVTISLVYYFAAYESISGNVIRLHILPNSNLAEDMEMKLAVRDELLSAMSGKLTLGSSKAEVAGSTKKIEKIANDYLARHNAPYSAQVRLENTFIPRKSYADITMPAGEYTAIRVLLGEGRGENWWCVAYPPLCFTEDTLGGLSSPAKAELSQKIGGTGYNIIGREIKYELKLIELAERLINKMKNN